MKLKDLLHGLQGLTGSHRVSQGLTGSHRVSTGSHRVHRVYSCGGVRANVSTRNTAKCRAVQPSRSCKEHNAAFRGFCEDSVQNMCEPIAEAEQRRH